MKNVFSLTTGELTIEYPDTMNHDDLDECSEFIDLVKIVMRRRADKSVARSYGGPEISSMQIAEHDCKPQYMGMFNSGAYRCTKCGLYFPTNKPKTRCSPPGDLGSDVTSEAVHAVSKDSPVASNAPIQAEAAALEELGKSGVIYPEHDWEGEVIDDGMRYHCIRCGRDITYTNSDKAVVRLPSGPCVVKRD